MVITPRVYVQFKAAKLYLTTDGGGSWTEVAQLSQQRVGRAVVGGPAADPTIYQAIWMPGGRNVGLAKITGFRASTGAGQAASVTQCIGNDCTPPAPGTGGSGLNNIRWYQIGFLQSAVFAVDPADSQHLIAADAADQKMKVSRDGGATWTNDDKLTELVTFNGILTFGSQPLVIAFHPPVGDLVLIGTLQAGIIASRNGGRTWSRIADSTKVPRITSFFFDTLHSAVYVSSYGRGLWKLGMRGWRSACLLLPAPVRDTYCPTRVPSGPRPLP